jgi:hypothetical protein
LLYNVKYTFGTRKHTDEDRASKAYAPCFKLGLQTLLQFQRSLQISTLGLQIKLMRRSKQIYENKKPEADFPLFLGVIQIHEADSVKLEPHC